MYGQLIKHTVRDINQALKNNCFNVYLDKGIEGIDRKRVFYVKTIKGLLKANISDSKWHTVSETDKLVLM